jgi:type IV pilus assembly protein PilC
MQWRNGKNFVNIQSRITARFSEVRSLNIFSPRLSVQEQTFFIKRLSFLIRAGVPMLDSLQMLRGQTPSRRHVQMMNVVIDDVTNGQSLSRSLGKFPQSFGDFVINIIRIGEVSGILSQNLEHLAEELKKRQMLRRKMVGAFMYPIVISIATLGITGMIIGYIFPKILPIFAAMRVDLPLSTRVVISVSDTLQSHGLTIVLLLVFTGTCFSVLLRMHRFSRTIAHAVLLRMPVIGGAVRAYHLANITRTLGLLLQSGILLGSALEIVSDTTENMVYKHALKDIGERVDRGDRISFSLAQHHAIFPALMTQLVGVGERTGSLSESLVYLSELYEHEVDEVAKDLSGLLEPMLMVIMGILVGFLAISVISPMYAITQHIGA